MVVDEELLEFAHEFLSQVFHVLHMGVTMILQLDRYYSIVPFCFLFFRFFALDDADYAAFQQAARKSGLIHQHQHINRIAIL